MYALQYADFRPRPYNVRDIIEIVIDWPVKGFGWISGQLDTTLMEFSSVRELFNKIEDLPDQFCFNSEHCSGFVQGNNVTMRLGLSAKISTSNASWKVMFDEVSRQK